MRRATQALLLTAAIGLIGCSGPAAKPPTGPDPIGPGPRDDAGTTANGTTANGATEDPAARLVALVDEIVAKVGAAADCDALANTLAVWTNRNQQTIAALITQIESQTRDSADAARFDQRVVDGYLVVVEAAADCGSSEAAMSAYDSFTRAVEKATY